MDGKSDTLEFQLLRLVFNGVPISSLAATAGTTQLWAGLRTADAKDGSTANEGGYAQYTCVATQRASASWSVTSGTSNAVASASPIGNVDFPRNTFSSTGAFTHGSIWLSSNVGSSGCLYTGTLTPAINFSQNVTPRLTTASSVTES